MEQVGWTALAYGEAMLRGADAALSRLNAAARDAADPFGMVEAVFTARIGEAELAGQDESVRTGVFP